MPSNSTAQLNQLFISFNDLLFLIMNIYLQRFRLQILFMEQNLGVAAVYNSRFACSLLWVSRHWDLFEY